MEFNEATGQRTSSLKSGGEDYERVCESEHYYTFIYSSFSHHDSEQNPESSLTLFFHTLRPIHD